MFNIVYNYKILHLAKSTEHNNYKLLREADLVDLIKTRNNFILNQRENNESVKNQVISYDLQLLSMINNELLYIDKTMKVLILNVKENSDIKATFLPEYQGFAYSWQILFLLFEDIKSQDKLQCLLDYNLIIKITHLIESIYYQRDAFITLFF